MTTKETDTSQMELIRELLTNQELSTELYDEFVEIIYPVEGFFVEQDHKEMALVVRNLLREMFIAELNWIERTSESPIERMFCTGVLLIAKTKYYNLLRFTPTSAQPIDEYREYTKSWIEAVEEWNRQFEEAGSTWTVQLFDSMVEQGYMDQEMAAGLGFYKMMYEVMGYKDAFHLTQQAWLPPSVSIGGRRVRPDLYVWLPLDKSFKLIIECDGYSYHSNRESFTHDRRRDRALKTHGYEVLRFSGIEIHANPLQMALELVDYLEEKHLSLARTPLHPSNPSSG